MPPTSSGGVALVEMFNILEGYDLEPAVRFGPHDASRRGIDAPRLCGSRPALGDPDFNPGMPIDRLVSKDYATKVQGDDQPGARIEIEPGQL